MCTCRFVLPGAPMNNKGCAVHTKQAYACDDCECDDYRPMKKPRPHESLVGGFHWPLCKCGHIAQAHN